MTESTLMSLRDFFQSSSVGGSTARDLRIGRTSANELLLSTDVASEDALGMSIKYTAGTSVSASTVTTATPVTGDGSASDPVTIEDDAITLAKLAGGTAGKVIGFDASGDPAELDQSSGGLSTVETNAPVTGDGSTGDPVTIADGAIGNVKISALDAAKLTGTIADARIPSAIARDTELPAANRLVPSSGTDGQVLTKASGTDFDVAWEEVPSIETDSTLSGTGTSSDPFGIADGGVGAPQLAEGVVSEGKLEASNSPADGQILSYDATDGLTWADDAGLLAVSTDSTLDGDGTSSDPLEIAHHGVGRDHLSADSVTTIKILDDSVTQAKLAVDSVGTDQVIDDSVTQAKLAVDSVGEDQLLDGAVTPFKIPSDAIKAGHIADAQIRTDHLGADSVTGAKISDGEVDTEHLADESVTEGKMDIFNAPTDEYVLTYDGSDGMIWREVNSLTHVSTDDTLIGDGTASDELGLADAAVTPVKLDTLVSPSGGQVLVYDADAFISATAWDDVTEVLAAQRASQTLSGSFTISVRRVFWLTPGTSNASMDVDFLADTATDAYLWRFEVRDGQVILLIGNSPELSANDAVRNMAQDFLDEGSIVFEAGDDSFEFDIADDVLAVDSTEPYSWNLTAEAEARATAFIDAVIAQSPVSTTSSVTLQFPEPTRAAATSLDAIYRLAATEPAAPAGGTDTANHAPTGWNRNNGLDSTETESVWRATRTVAAGRMTWDSADTTVATSELFNGDVAFVANMAGDSTTRYQGGRMWELRDSDDAALAISSNREWLLISVDGSAQWYRLFMEDVRDLLASSDDDEAVLSGSGRNALPFPMPPMGNVGFTYNDYYLGLTSDGELTIGVSDSSDLETISLRVRSVTAESGDSGGLESISSDFSLAGDGTSSSPLKIAEGGVTVSKLGADSVGARAMAIDSVETDSIVDDAVTGDKIESAAIHSHHLRDDSVTTAKIDDGAVTNVKVSNINAASITSGELDVGRIPDLPAEQVTSGTFLVNRIPEQIARLDNPVFTGNPQGPTRAVGDDSNSFASTAFVQAAFLSALGGGMQIETPIMITENTTIDWGDTTDWPQTVDATACLIVAQGAEGGSGGGGGGGAGNRYRVQSNNQFVDSGGHGGNGGEGGNGGDATVDVDGTEIMRAPGGTGGLGATGGSGAGGEQGINSQQSGHGGGAGGDGGPGVTSLFSDTENQEDGGVGGIGFLGETGKISFASHASLTTSSVVAVNIGSVGSAGLGGSRGSGYSGNLSGSSTNSRGDSGSTGSAGSQTGWVVVIPLIDQS